MSTYEGHIALKLPEIDPYGVKFIEPGASCYLYSGSEEKLIELCAETPSKGPVLQIQNLRSYGNDSKKITQDRLALITDNELHEIFEEAIYLFSRSL